jgi:hypothetical protein
MDNTICNIYIGYDGKIWSVYGRYWVYTSIYIYTGYLCISIHFIDETMICCIFNIVPGYIGVCGI